MRTRENVWCKYTLESSQHLNDTMKTNITPGMSDFWLSVSFIEQEVMVLQCLTITLPLVSVLNSDQVTTEPLGILQFVYWEAISFPDRTRSHMLTSASWAFSVSSSVNLLQGCLDLARALNALQIGLYIPLENPYAGLQIDRFYTVWVHHKYFPKWNTNDARHHHRPKHWN